ESCLLAWELTLDTNADESVIREIFDWAEGDCELEITAAQPPAAEVSAPTPAPQPAPPEALVATARADETSESAAPKPETKRPNLSLASSNDHAAAHKPNIGDASSIRASTEKIDELMNAVGELVITQSMLSQLGA